MAERESTAPVLQAGKARVKLPVVASPPTLLEAAILETVLYFDLFSYPVTALEIQRFLPGQAASLAQVETTLSESAYLQHILEKAGPYYFLPGQNAIVTRRLERQETSQQCWQAATPYLKWLKAVPFLRTALVTGALAMDNAPAQDDIDLLLLTTPGRLWLCRAWVILIVRLARLQQVTLCPNYLLTTDNLEIPEHDLYTAHELNQMRFLFGQSAYNLLLEKNEWASEFLPNAHPGLPEAEQSNWPERIQRLGEWLFSGKLGQVLENWERKRKIARFCRLGGDETRFSEKVCKGHYNGHAHRTLQLLAERKAALGL